MNTRLLTTLRRDRRDTFPDDILRIRLSRVDDVVDRLAAAKTGMLAGDRISRRHPDFATIRILVKLPVIKIEPEDAELPHLVSDVLAGVGDGAVGADEDLVALVLVRALVLLERHHPTAFLLAFVDVMNDAELLHRLERLVPKMQVQNFALARQQVVAY